MSQEELIPPTQDVEYVHPLTAQYLTHSRSSALTLEEVKALREEDRKDKQLAADLEEQRGEAEQKTKDAEHRRRLETIQAVHRRRLETIQAVTRPICAIGLWTTGVVLALHGLPDLAATVIGAGTAVFLGKRKQQEGKKKT